MIRKDAFRTNARGSASAPTARPNLAESKEDDRMSHDQDLFDPNEAGGETTRENQDPANVADGAVKHRSEGGTPRERADGHPISNIPTDRKSVV